MLEKNDPPDITVGDLFDFVRREAPHSHIIDDELDADLMWAMFQREVSDSFGVEPSEVTKERWLIHDLGAG